MNNGWQWFGVPVGQELVQQGLDPGLDLVADGADRVNVLTRGVGKRPVEVKRLFEVNWAMCFSRLRPAGIGGYTPTVSGGVG